MISQNNDKKENMYERRPIYVMFPTNILDRPTL